MCFIYFHHLFVLSIFRFSEHRTIRAYRLISTNFRLKGRFLAIWSFILKQSIPNCMNMHAYIRMKCTTGIASKSNWLKNVRKKNQNKVINRTYIYSIGIRWCVCVCISVCWNIAISAITRNHQLDQPIPFILTLFWQTKAMPMLFLSASFHRTWLEGKKNNILWSNQCAIFTAFTCPMCAHCTHKCLQMCVKYEIKTRGAISIFSI